MAKQCRGSQGRVRLGRSLGLGHLRSGVWGRVGSGSGDLRGCGRDALTTAGKMPALRWLVDSPSGGRGVYLQGHR